MVHWMSQVKEMRVETWLLVEFNKVEISGYAVWWFGNRQCLARVVAFFFPFLFIAAPATYGSSQARG